jgi:hypothetical protein
LEKPRGEADHISMLKMLRDEGEHKVMTAMAVMRPLETATAPGYKMETHVEETTVKFDGNGALRPSLLPSCVWHPTDNAQSQTNSSSHT